MQLALREVLHRRIAETDAPPSIAADDADDPQRTFASPRLSVRSVSAQGRSLPVGEDDAELARKRHRARLSNAELDGRSARHHRDLDCL